MSEIKVVPCPDHEFRYAITTDGQYETDKDGIWCAMLEAKAQEKAIQLSGHHPLCNAGNSGCACICERLKKSTETSDPIEQAAPPRPLEILCSFCRKPMSLYWHDKLEDAIACREKVEAGLPATAAIEQARPQTPKLENKCTSTIEVSGTVLTCELFNGPEHNPKHSHQHRAELQESQNKWRVVEWGFKRLVTPPRVG